MKNFIIKSDGTKLEVAPERKKHFELEEMQIIVGGLIQLLYLNDGSIMVCNEEGKLLGLPYNKDATEMLSDSPYVGDFICGDVLICEFKMMK